MLGRNGCGKSCLMKILSGSLKAGFCSMRIDGKWHRRFTEKEIRYLPQHPFIPGWLRLERALGDFGLQREDLERWFPEFISLRGTRIGELSSPLLSADNYIRIKTIVQEKNGRFKKISEK